MSCGVGCRRGSDPALLWPWRRPVATAPIGPLAWEPPYAIGAALKKKIINKNDWNWSSPVTHWIKDPMLSLPCFRSLLWYGFDPWPGNFYVPWVQPKKKKKKRMMGAFKWKMQIIDQEKKNETSP